MIKPHFRSLAEQFYLGHVAIQNDMGVDRLEKFLQTMLCDGILRYVDGAIISIKRTKDPDEIFAEHTYHSKLPVFKLSEVLRDSVIVENLLKCYSTVVDALTKIENPIIRELAIRNINLDFATNTVPVQEILKITESHDGLKVAFSWQNTDQGVAFWSAVHEIEEKGGKLTTITKDIMESLKVLDATSKLKHVTMQEIAEKFGVAPENLVVV